MGADCSARKDQGKEFTFVTRGINCIEGRIQVMAKLFIQNR